MKFKKLPDKITYGDKYGPAMKVKTKVEADECLRRCIEHNMRVGKHTLEEATRIELGNLGYYAGYYDNETQARVEKLFKAVHPIFGPVSNGPVSPEKAFKMGQDLMEAHLKKKRKKDRN